MPPAVLNAAPNEPEPRKNTRIRALCQLSEGLPSGRVSSSAVAASVISFARCIGTFGTVLILAGGTYMKTEVLPTTLYLNISYGNMGMALTSGIVLMVVSFVAIYIFEKTEAAL